MLVYVKTVRTFTSIMYVNTIKSAQIMYKDILNINTAYKCGTIVLRFSSPSDVRDQEQVDRAC